MLDEHIADAPQLGFPRGVGGFRQTAQLKTGAVGGDARIGRVLEHHAVRRGEAEPLRRRKVDVRLAFGHADVLDGQHELEILHHIPVEKRLFRVAAGGQRRDRHLDALPAHPLKEVEHAVLRHRYALVARGDERIHAAQHNLYRQLRSFLPDSLHDSS